MKGAHHDPVDHSRTTQPHAGESFIDTLWLPGLGLIALGIVVRTVARLDLFSRHGQCRWASWTGWLVESLSG